jgi:Uncharacterised nucleotidyltransferase/Transglutaminase-like superfamily
MTGMRDRLEQFLVRGERAGLTGNDLRRANLAGFAYTALPVDDPLRAELRPDFVSAALRHAEIKAYLLPLLEACQQEGLRVVLFKGFPQAEFLYDAPAMRFYGDVDMLIRAEDTARIVEIALSLGWTLQYTAEILPVIFTHPSVLISPGGVALLELQSTVLQSYNPTSRRLTKAVFESSDAVALDGASVRVLEPTDALLVMYLNRAWGDFWGRKVHDYPDAKNLIEKRGVTQKALQARAAELGLGRVLRLAMESCDPWREKLHLGRMSRARVWSWGLRAFPSWGAMALQQFTARVRLLPLAARFVMKALGLLREADNALGHHSDLNDVLRSLTPPPAAPGDEAQLPALTLYTTIGLRWALRLQRRSARSCVPRSLALYRALRLQGYEVSFVSGVERHGNARQLEGHAWVEWQGRPLAGTGDEAAPARFKPLFRFPEAGPAVESHSVTG